MILTQKKALKLAKKDCSLPVLAHYRDGNHYETIFEDGTKVSQTIFSWSKRLTFDFPTNMDLKISDQCPVGCKYCHESSTPNGKFGNIMDLPFVDTLVPGTECAIGGGSALNHPDLVPFLRKLKKQGVLANLTVNQKELQIPNLAQKMKVILKEDLVHGVGVSLTDNKTFNKTVDEIFGDYPNLVVHTIAGILNKDDMPCIKGRKTLILGYKDLKGRRAGEFYESDKAEIEKNITALKLNLPYVRRITKLISFDCLAIKQLDPRKRLWVSDKDWNTLFQGDDYDETACRTLYVDAVTRTVARASTHPLNDRPKFTDESISELFKMSKKCLKMSKHK